MINVLIWGTEEISRLLKKLIEKLYNHDAPLVGGDLLNVIGFIGEEKSEQVISDERVLSVEEAVEEYQKQIVTAIIIPIDLFIGINNIYSSLTNGGVDVNDIYLFERSNNFDSKRMVEMIQPYLSSKYLPYLEYHIADHCNLNCKACEHYSGLVENPKFPKYEEFEKQMYRLKELIDDIGVIRILGGEPLLNKEIEKYLVLSRKLYPYASICIVTNAVLIKSMPDSLFETMRREKIYFSISFYPPLKETMGEILKFIESKNTSYFIFDIAEKFTVKQTLIKQNDTAYFGRCLQAKCNNFYEGKLAACFLPFTTRYFNEAFKEELEEPLPLDGAIDIMSDDVTTEEIKKRLITPFERCRYCVDAIEIDWETIGKEKKLSDWVQI